MGKRITKIEIIPNYDDGFASLSRHKDCTLRIEYSDGTGGTDPSVPYVALSGVLEILRRASPIAMEALMASWMA